MNETSMQILVVISGATAVWCTRELLFPKRDHRVEKAKTVVATQDTCQKRQPIAKETANRTGDAHAVIQEDQKQPGGTPTFQKEVIQNFWVQNCIRLQEPFRAIIFDVLCKYDNMEEERPKIFRNTKPSSFSFETFMTLEQIPLWRHAVNTATEFIVKVPGKERGGPFFSLGLLACLGHDIGKPPYDPRTYSATANAQQSAEVMKQIIRGRLHLAQEIDLLSAIQERPHKKHKGTNSLTRLLQEAHGRGKDLELREVNVVTLASKMK